MKTYCGSSQAFVEQQEMWKLIINGHRVVVVFSINENILFASNALIM